MEYNTFLFDLDGTLIDSSEGIINSVIYALKKFGIEEMNVRNCMRLSDRRLRILLQNIMDFLKKKAGKRLSLTASIIKTKAFLSVSCMMGYLMC